MMCESILSTNAEIAPITVAMVNQTALRALLCFFSEILAHNMKVRPWPYVLIFALRHASIGIYNELACPVMMNWLCLILFSKFRYYTSYG